MPRVRACDRPRVHPPRTTRQRAPRGADEVFERGATAITNSRTPWYVTEGSSYGRGAPPGYADSSALCDASDDVSMPPSVEEAIRYEMMRRMNDGWVLHGERTSAEMTMRHIVLPPAWRLAVDLINPFAWLFGVTWTAVYRTLTVRADQEERLHRRTTGKIPKTWPQRYSWEVPDGPIELQDAVRHDSPTGG